MSHYLSEIAFDANGYMPDTVNGRRRAKPKLAVPLEKARWYAEQSFHAGTLAALDVVYLHDQPTIAGEIVGATDEKALLRHAVREEYYNLAKLRLTIRMVKRRTAKRRRLDDTEKR
jgi:hypothetical protein